MTVVRGLVGLVAVGVLALTLSPWLDAITPGWLPAVQALIRAWGIIAVVGLVVALGLRAWWSATVFVVAALAAAVVVINVTVPRCEPSDRRLSVLALNTQFSSASATEVAAIVAEREVDVLLLSEVNEGYLEDLQAHEELDHLVHRHGEAPTERSTQGTVILSAWPGVALDVQSQISGFGQPAMELDVEGRNVVVRAVHVKPPMSDMLDDWREGLRELGQWQRTVQGKPLVLAGDFNASRAHAPFRDASHRLAFTAGRFAAATWPNDRAWGPFTDIDHVLTRDMAVIDHATLDVTGTDHRSVWTNVAICR